jgi:cytochrome c1
VIALLSGCQRGLTISDGDPARGRVLIDRKACGSCHLIPGIAQADGRVGPPLAHFGSQQMIAGVLSNSHANLQRYLKAPQAVVPGNAMPDQHLSDSEARDIAAYLLARR